MPKARSPLYERLASMDIGGRAVLVQGIDYEGDPEIKRTNIHQAMRHRGISCSTTRHDGQITVTILRKDN